MGGSFLGAHCDFPLLFQEMPSKCKTEGCELVAWYGTTKRVACNLHKTEEMTHVGHTKCDHGRRKSLCVECNGSQTCDHGRRRTLCPDCGGSQLCRHGKHKSHCVECEGPHVCDHGKRKDRCLECGGAELCQCGNYKHPRYDGWCAECFHREYPDDPRSINVNDAELRLAQHLQAHPQVRQVTKTAINCNGRMLVPDAILRIEGGGTLMIELDGPQHFDIVPFMHPKGIDDFVDQVERDCAKNQYARQKGWSLLRISYREYKSLEEIVDKFISDFVEGGREQLFRVTNAELYNSVPKG